MCYIVTHGDKYPGANPGMTEKGFDEVRPLRDLLPEISLVICGTGRRHADVASALRIVPSRFTSVVGDGDSMEIVDGVKTIVLADGSYINPEWYTALEDLAPVAKALIASLGEDDIVCAGRPLMIMLGFPQGKSAAVYKVGPDGVIEEVIAKGVPDPCLA